ncbi:MAG: sarcosine oxidase subunit delta [Gaiellales bacterium]
MTFLLPCPNCGPREVEEFRCTGELTRRPTGSPDLRELMSYVYFRENAAGVHREWWYHRHGCGLWFVAERDTRNGRVIGTEIPGPA